MSSGAGMNGLRVVDLFAGPGGWDVAAVELGRALSEPKGNTE